jgi:hypothetical protein
MVISRERVCGCHITYTREEGAPVIKDSGSREELKESFRLRNPNDPRLGGRATPFRRGGVCTRVVSELDFFCRGWVKGD